MTPPVTAHAVLRWITRIYGDSLRPEVKQFGRDGFYTEKAIAAAQRIGISYEDIQLIIAPPAFWADIRSGLVHSLRHNSMTLQIKGGVVCTILADNGKQNGRRIKLTNRKEANKGSQRFFRRGGNKRVPA